MNGLNLRISGNTTKLKKKECVKENVSQFIPILKIDADTASVFDDFLAASSMEEQITSLKKVISNLSVPESGSDFVIDSILKMLLQLDLKSPLSAAILRLLVNISDDLKPIVQKNIESLIRAHVCNDEGNDEFVNFISLCIDNSHASHFSINSCADDILHYFERSLVTKYDELRIETTPTKKLIFIDSIHQIVRCSIALIQKTDVMTSEILFDTSWKILNDSQLPLNTRSNCGILHIYSYKLLKGSFDYIEFTDATRPNCKISELCIDSGILNTLSPEELSADARGSPVLNLILDDIVTIEDSDPADCSLVLVASRCILLVTRSLLDSPHVLNEEMLNKLLSYIWIHLEHYMDAVRHLASSSLSNIVLLGETKGKDELIFETIANDLKSIPVEKRSKHAALSALVGHMPIRKLLTESPNLVSALFDSAKTSSGVNHAVASMEALMGQHYKEKIDSKDWYDLWVDPLLDIIKDNPNPASQRLFMAVVKIHPDVIHHIVELHNANNGIYLNALLVCLRVGRKFGFLIENDTETKWKGLIEFTELDSFMYHSNDDIRISSFSLITETQKGTELYSEKELELVKTFLKYNISNQVPSTRQSLLAAWKKFWSRLDNSLHATYGRVSKRKGLQTDAQTLQLYSSFIQWLQVDFIAVSLHAKGNFSNRLILLNILTMCQEMRSWRVSYEGFRVIETAGLAKSLLLCLFDSYEEIKILAKNLLVLMPSSCLKLDDPNYVQTFFNQAISMASSIRPPDSISAAYFMAVFIQFSPPCFITPSQVPHKMSLFALNSLLSQLKKELDVAETSLLMAASSGPMYGLLFVIRHVLSDVDMKSIDKYEDWTQFIQDLILTAFRCNAAVASVVNNSSPEGHLPMDFDYDTSKLEGCGDRPKVTSQMVLLCSWRTVKEVSLLLGELAENAPISSSDGQKGLITEEQIIEIGNHLITLLAEVKHRGAFEQAYIGFCSLASRLWRCPTGNLYELPTKWMNETITEISSNDKLSATRRSAGIPFVVQGLVCTELQVGGGMCFHRGMKLLLNLARNEDSHVDSRAHALNILRALFRHSLLGEVVSPYVADGLALAMEGFNSSTWAERNSSTLLFSALMTRVFGVPRSKSEVLSWKNKMTGRIFFQRYPSLFGVLLKHLENSSKAPLYPAIYPALLILGRLYPSSLEGTDSNLQLYKYIPFVEKCAGSSIFKTRALAAQAMVALITPNMFLNHVNSIFCNLLQEPTENLTHGLLLQIFKLLQNIPDETRELIGSVPYWLHCISLLLKRNRHSYTVKSCCLKILILLLNCPYPHLSSDFYTEPLEMALLSVNTDQSHSRHRSFGFIKYLQLSSLLVLNAHYKMRKLNFLLKFLKILLVHQEHSVFAICCDFISSALLETEFNVDDYDDVESFDFEYDEFHAELQSSLKTNFDFSSVVVELIGTRTHHEDRKKLLSLVKCLPLVYKQISGRNRSVVVYFKDICQQNEESLGSLAFQCITAYLSLEDYQVKDEYELMVLLEMIQRYSLPESDPACRNAVASLFTSKFDYLLTYCSDEQGLILWTALMRLINDDDSDVREKVTLLFGHNIVPLRGFELLLSKFVTFKYSSIVKLCALFAWCLGDLSEEVTVVNDESVFDKENSKNFLEEASVSRVMTECVGKLLKDCVDLSLIVEQPLSPGLVEWMSQQCGACLKGTSFRKVTSELLNESAELLDTQLLSSFDELLRPKKMRSSLFH